MVSEASISEAAETAACFRGCKIHTCRSKLSTCLVSNKHSTTMLALATIMLCLVCEQKRLHASAAAPDNTRSTHCQDMPL